VVGSREGLYREGHGENKSRAARCRSVRGRRYLEFVQLFRCLERKGKRLVNRSGFEHYRLVLAPSDSGRLELGNGKFHELNKKKKKKRKKKSKRKNSPKKENKQEKKNLVAGGEAEPAGE
jgi:hypothetical protein